MELMIRARTTLYIILVTALRPDDSSYAETKEYFQQAADQELLDMNDDH